MMIILTLLAIYLALEWPVFKRLSLGFFWFCCVLLALAGLCVGFLFYWLFDEGLRKLQESLQDFLAVHIEDFE